MCGVVGIVGNSPVNQRIYDALTVVQHRGQDAAGRRLIADRIISHMDVRYLSLLTGSVVYFMTSFRKNVK